MNQLTSLRSVKFSTKKKEPGAVKKERNTPKKEPVIDPETGEIYHISFKPPPSEISHRLIQRKDDTEETVRQRLSSYHEQTRPLGEWYQDLGLLIAVDGAGPIEEVSKSVANAISIL